MAYLGSLNMATGHQPPAPLLVWIQPLVAELGCIMHMPACCRKEPKMADVTSQSQHCNSGFTRTETQHDCSLCW